MNEVIGPVLKLYDLSMCRLRNRIKELGGIIDTTSKLCYCKL